jgi:hypothetical protein
MITIEQHKKKFLGVQKLVVVCYFEFLTPLNLRGHNFLISNLFMTIFNASMCQKEGFNICLDTKNKKSFPLDLDYRKRLNVLKLA